MSKKSSHLFPEDYNGDSLDGQVQASLNELFHKISTYRKSTEFMKLLDFIARFRTYSAYNCFLLFVQNPEIGYVASLRDWKEKFNRDVKPGARALIILRPKGPVHFLYDLSDTIGDDTQLPPKVKQPFKTTGGFEQSIWDKTLKCCQKMRIWVTEEPSSMTYAGSITKKLPPDVSKDDSSPLYEIRLNSKHDLPTRYSTLVHELGHLLAGHLGGDNEGRWKDRQDLDKTVKEFEAESIAYLVCSRHGLNCQSEEYLAKRIKECEFIPDICFQTVVNAVKHIENMAEGQLPKTKNKTKS